MKRMENDPDLLEEYDFSNGVRGKYAQRYPLGAGTQASQDFDKLKELREAKRVEGDAPIVSLAEAKQALGLD